ncbi:MAG: diacylglycerol kinase family protein [Streptosporangiaceae bacterium]
MTLQPKTVPFQPKRVALVVNTRSRSGERAFSEASELLRDRGVPLDVTCPLRDPGGLPGAVREALDGGCDLLILGGGDGTVTSVVDVDLGLASSDSGRDHGDDYFVNVASAGVSVGVTEALSPWLKQRAGALAYPVAAVRAFLRHKPYSARLTFPDGDRGPVERDRLLQVAVGNGRFYGGGMVVAPDAGIDDKTLDVYAIELGRTRDLVGVARYLKSGDFIREENVTHVRTTRVELETDPVLSMNIDGEVSGRTPTSFRVARNALRVLVPEESNEARLDTSR